MKKKRSFKSLVYLLLISSVLAAAFYGVAAKSRADRSVDPSRLAEVVRGTMVRSVVATGKIEPIAKVEIKSKANGIIKVLHVRAGDLVERGEILAELDQDDLLPRVRQAEANLQSAQAALEEAQAELRKNTVEAAGPDVEYYRSMYRRSLELNKQGLAAQSDVDKARSDLDLAENRRQAAQSQLAVTTASIDQARANVAQAKATLEQAREDLANATIRAPIHGIVLTRDVEVGSPVSSILNMGSAATLVMTLGDIDRVLVRGKVDEADIGSVQLDQPARITVESFRNRVFAGKVTRISPMGVEKDNVTTFEVEVSIDNPGQELKVNMTANAEIILETHKNTLIVPVAAVRFDSRKEPFVEVPSSNGPEQVAVRLGIGDGMKSEVLSGLHAGEKVILP
jgi:HlyD family secretion protein